MKTRPSQLVKRIREHMAVQHHDVAPLGELHRGHRNCAAEHPVLV
jgi:hypothetical protein